MTTVIDGLYNCSDKEALRDWLLERCPPENGYGITVTNTATGEEFSTALPRTPRSFIPLTEEPSFPERS